jgi:hypothetical protein
MVASLGVSLRVELPNKGLAHAINSLLQSQRPIQTTTGPLQVHFFRVHAYKTFAAKNTWQRFRARQGIILGGDGTRCPDLVSLSENYCGIAGLRPCKASPAAS